MPPDEALRSPFLILASLFPNAAKAALHAAGDDLPGLSQRGKPRPSVGGRPADFARLDWAKAHRRISAPQGFQLRAAPRTHDEALPSPSQILASVYPGAAKAALHSGADVASTRSQRGEPRPSVGGRPADTARVLDWTRKYRRFVSAQARQLTSQPAHSTVARWEHRSKCIPFSSVALARRGHGHWVAT